MKADLYDVTSTVNNMKNGEIEKKWSVVDTIDCLAKGYVTKSSGTNSTEVSSNQSIILTKEEVKLRSSDPIPSTYRVSNIRNSSSILVWKEENTSAGIAGATIFEVNGSTPLVDFDGTVLGYETILKRQDIQSLVLDEEV